MSVTGNQLKAWRATVMVTSLSPPTEDVGGALADTGNPSNEITGSSIGEVHATMAAAVSGGGTRRQYSKWFILNTSSDDLSDAKFYLASLDDSPSGPFNCTSVSDSALDDNNSKTRFIGVKSNGDPWQSEVLNAGTTEIQSPEQFNALIAVENRHATTGALQASAGNRIISCGSTVVGVLAAGKYSITGEIKVGLPDTLNDASTADDALTAPAGVTFTKPRTLATALSFGNGGILTGGAAQPVWSEYSVVELRKPSPDLQCYSRVEGDSL